MNFKYQVNKKNKSLYKVQSKELKLRILWLSKLRLNLLKNSKPPKNKIQLKNFKQIIKALLH